MRRLEHFFLGPFEVRLDGKPVTAFESDKVRALLAYLITEASEGGARGPHSRDALATLVWPDQPDETARQNLRHVLYKLRQALHDGESAGVPPFLLVTPQTVGLNPVADTWLDVSAFSGLIAACRAHRHRRLAHCSVCMTRLREATTLYRGEFLEGFFLGESAPFEEWLLIEREGLHRQAVDAFVALAAHHESRGEYEHALEYAYRQLRLEPWREESHRQVMRLLAMTGRRSTALAQYEACRKVLADELSARPDAHTQALYEQIRDQNPETSSLLQAHVPPNNLPSQLTPFIGREEELALIADLLQDPDYRLLTIAGPGGIGKTRLAIRAASEQVGAFQDGIFAVFLADVQSPRFLASSIAQALNLAAKPAEEPRSLLLDYLRDKEMLLVLDNFEHLVEGTELLVEVLQYAPGVSLLVTSREHLGLQAQYIFDIEGLSYPTEGEATERGIAGYSAPDLFAERARRAQRDFTLSAKTVRGVLEICRLVEGMPLGIVLAAARVGQFTPSEIAAAIRRNLDFLATSFRDLPRQHRSLRAVFDYSWSLLTGREQEVFQKLSVFRGGFDAQAAEEVAGANHGLLGAFMQRSLIRHASEGRFEMHELLRQYASEKLTATPELNEVTHIRYIGYFLALSETADAQSRLFDQKTWLDRLEIEHNNLRAALLWAIDTGRVEAGLRIASALSHFWWARGYVSEGRVHLAAALRLAGEAATENTDEERSITQVKARALRQVGALAREQSEYGAAHALLTESLALYRKLGDKTEIAEVLAQLGPVAWRQGDFKSAQASYEEGLAIMRELGNKANMPRLLNNYAVLLMDMGDYPLALSVHKENLALEQEAGDDYGTAISLLNVALVYWYQGDYPPASSYAAESLALIEKLGHKPGISLVLNLVGYIAHDRGEYEIAHARHTESLSIKRELGEKNGMAECFEGLARVASQAPAPLGDPVRAARLWGAADALRETIGSHLTAADRAHFEASMTALHSQLDEEAYNAAYAYGRGMTLEQALTYALDPL